MCVCTQLLLPPAESARCVCWNGRFGGKALHYTYVTKTVVVRCGFVGNPLTLSFCFLLLLCCTERELGLPTYSTNPNSFPCSILSIVPFRSHSRVCVCVCSGVPLCCLCWVEKRGFGTPTVPPCFMPPPPPYGEPSASFARTPAVHGVSFVSGFGVPSRSRIGPSGCVGFQARPFRVSCRCE